MDAVTKPNVMVEDSDDEDLEALRLAALQSIKNKPTVVTPRRRPKPVCRPNRHRVRNFHRGCVNSNLIAIVPLEIPLKKDEASYKSTDPPPLVLPQDRYCKKEVKSEEEEKEMSAPSKFSRFEDSNSGDSDDDLDEDFGTNSSEGEKQGEGNDRNDDESVADEDELLLQDEDSLGKFITEFAFDVNDSETVKTESAKALSKNDQSKNISKSTDKLQKEKGSDGIMNKEITKAESPSRKLFENKVNIFEKRSDSENKQSKNERKGLSRNLSPQNEESKRINQPCIFGRNRSPSPFPRVKQFVKHQEFSNRSSLRQEGTPKKRSLSPSPDKLSPLRKRELSHKASFPSSHPVHAVHPVGSSPCDVTPPPQRGSRSDSSQSYPHSLPTHREWSSSPLKCTGSNSTGFTIDSPHKKFSPSHKRRRSRSPVHKSSRIYRSSERDWSGSPPRRKSRDFDTPPDSQRSTNDSFKTSRRRSNSPIKSQRVGERSKQSDRSGVADFSLRHSSPSKRSPIKVSRRSSPAHSSSRTPSLSPSPEPEGKSSAGNYRRYKSPLRLPGYRSQNLRERTYRSDGKSNRKDMDRQHAVKQNALPKKVPESKVEVNKAKSANVKLEVKHDEPSPQKKVDAVREVIQTKSPSSSALPSSWSSEEGESDSDSRFKGTDSKVIKPVIVAPKIPLSTITRRRDIGETSPKSSPKKKKSKRSKKTLIRVKVKDDGSDEVKEKQSTVDVDLRAELSRRRAERVNKNKNIPQNMPVRLLQSAFQGLKSKTNSINGERGNFSTFAIKSELGSDGLMPKKKPIHLRLGLPVARNPDPPEQVVSVNSILPRISGIENKEISEASVDGGIKCRKVKLKRSVTVQKSLPRGTPSSSTNTSGKEQVMSVSQLMLLILAGLSPGSPRGHENPAPYSLNPLPYLSHYVAGVLQSHLVFIQEKFARFTAGDSAIYTSCQKWSMQFVKDIRAV